MPKSLKEGKPESPADRLNDQMSDEELVLLFRQSSNQDVIGMLFKRYSHLVLGVCYKYLHDRESARDTAMEVFESLFVSLKKYEVHNFKAWLITVTKSYCARIIRENKKEFVSIHWEENLLGEVMENGGFSHLNFEEDSEETIRKVNLAVGGLSPGQQQCILLFYFEGKSYQQITEITGFSLNDVKSFIQNGKRNLRNNLEQTIF